MPRSWRMLAVGALALVSLGGASDLLPEAHRRFNLRVVAAVVAGAVVVPALAAVAR